MLQKIKESYKFFVSQLLLMLQKIIESYNFCGLIVLINALKDNRKFTQKLTQYSFIKIQTTF